MSAIHQFLPTFEPSAVGNHAVQVQKTLRDNGYESEIFAEFSRGAYEGLAHLHTDYGVKIPARDEDVLIYHMAIGSNVADFLLKRHQRLMVDHHNITPVSYYEPWDPGVTYGMAWGRRQLEQMAERASGGFADSEFNRRELEELHYAKTAVVPILTDFDVFDHAVDSDLLDRMQQAKAAGGTDWLFVGWIAPHKCQHDIIKSFAAYRELYDSNARLHLVGRTSSETYHRACAQLITALGLADSAFLHGQVNDAGLGAFYRIADVLVSMSEHEGVGIPLLEAMYHGVPIVAYSAAAVPETVADSGLLLERKSSGFVAVAVHRVATDESLRQELIERGSKRLEFFSLARNKARLKEAIALLD